MRGYKTKKKKWLLTLFNASTQKPAELKKRGRGDFDVEVVAEGSRPGEWPETLDSSLRSE
jgi:hypothetical protein